MRWVIRVLKIKSQYVVVWVRKDTRVKTGPNASS